MKFGFQVLATARIDDYFCRAVTSKNVPGSEPGQTPADRQLVFSQLGKAETERKPINAVIQ